MQERGGGTNLHIVALPMYEKHSGEYMAKLTTTVIDLLDAAWQSKVVGVASDGAKG